MVEPQNRTILQSWTGMHITLLYSTRSFLLHNSFAGLPARTRLFLSFGVCVMGATGLIISDYIEKVVPPTTPGQS